MLYLHVVRSERKSINYPKVARSTNMKKPQEILLISRGEQESPISAAIRIEIQGVGKIDVYALSALIKSMITSLCQLAD